MNRPKSTARDLPPRMLRRTKTLASGKEWVGYYYNGRDENGKRIEIPLGTDLNEAKRKWAELECKPAPVETGLMKHVFDRYEREIVPTKAPRTQTDNKWMLKFLRAVFDTAPIDAITPQHIARYRDSRKSKSKGSEGMAAPVRANREITLLSHVFNMAREWGYTAKDNPAKGIRKNREKPRDYYADDAVWNAVYGAAVEELQDAMDLAYLTGQRPADVLKMRFADIQGDAIVVQQNKTSKKLRILLEENGVRTELGRVIDRIRTRKGKVLSMSLISTHTGRPLNRWTLRSRFEDARATAVKSIEEAGDMAFAKHVREFQFRDIRPKAASETDLAHASKLLGHTEQEITEKVYRRVGEVVKPTK